MNFQEDDDDHQDHFSYMAPLMPTNGEEEDFDTLMFRCETDVTPTNVPIPGSNVKTNQVPVEGGFIVVDHDETSSKKQSGSSSSSSSSFGSKQSSDNDFNGSTTGSIESNESPNDFSSATMQDMSLAAAAEHEESEEEQEHLFRSRTTTTTSTSIGFKNQMKR